MERTSLSRYATLLSIGIDLLCLRAAMPEARASSGTLHIASRKWCQSIPVDSKLAYLNEVLSPSHPATPPPLVLMAKFYENYIYDYNSISLTTEYKSNIFRAVWKHQFVAHLACPSTLTCSYQDYRLGTGKPNYHTIGNLSTVPAPKSRFKSFIFDVFQDSSVVNKCDQLACQNL